VLLSLVRTSHAGHLRDVRRAIVAFSRARFGLYVFCRRSLFEACPELSPIFQCFCSRPATLQLVPGERWPMGTSTATAQRPKSLEVKDIFQMAAIVEGAMRLKTSVPLQGTTATITTDAIVLDGAPPGDPADQAMTD
jgi:hypothetical protein